MNPLCRDGYRPSVCQVLVNNQWHVYNGHGVDTEASLDWYSTNFTEFARGAYPTKYNNISQGLSSADSIFYKFKSVVEVDA